MFETTLLLWKPQTGGNAERRLDILDKILNSNHESDPTVLLSTDDYSHQFTVTVETPRFESPGDANSPKSLVIV